MPTKLKSESGNKGSGGGGESGVGADKPVITEITCHKFIKIPMEPYGGDKYEMLEVGLDVKATVAKGCDPQAIMAGTFKFIDEGINIIVTQETEALKSKKK
jgi:hypothetical protein